jgi:hypothetical protein
MVAREGIEPPTRGFSAQRSSATGATKPKTGKGLFRDRPGRPEPPTLFRTPLGRSEGLGEEPRSASTSCAGSDRTGAETLPRSSATLLPMLSLATAPSGLLHSKLVTSCRLTPPFTCAAAAVTARQLLERKAARQGCAGEDRRHRHRPPGRSVRHGAQGPIHPNRGHARGNAIFDIAKSACESSVRQRTDSEHRQLHSGFGSVGMSGAAADLSRSGIDQPTLLSAGTISYYRSTHADAR